MKTVLRILLFSLLACAAASAQSIEFPYRGLNYSMVTKDGITVMVAPMNLNIMNYCAAHVWVTNGSKRPVHIEPQYFVARAQGPKQPAADDFAAIPDAVVVTEVMQHARMNDVLSLVRAYE